MEDSCWCGAPADPAGSGHLAVLSKLDTEAQEQTWGAGRCQAVRASRGKPCLCAPRLAFLALRISGEDQEGREQ